MGGLDVRAFHQHLLLSYLSGLVVSLFKLFGPLPAALAVVALSVKYWLADWALCGPLTRLIAKSKIDIAEGRYESCR